MTPTEAKAVQRGAERADGGEQFGRHRSARSNLPLAIAGIECELWRVDAEIEADRAADHHGQQERLRRQRRNRSTRYGQRQTIRSQPPAMASPILSRKVG